MESRKENDFIQSSFDSFLWINEEQA